MKSLVLCEKPSVARDIARNLKASKKINGCLEGDNYVVTWALGHLVTLKTPDKYKEFSSIAINQLPMIHKVMQTEVISKTFHQYKIIEKAINRKDISDIIIATDAGREGELVARYILEKANNRKPIKRLWISSVTDKAIRDGFNHLKDGKLYQGLYNAGMARANADWLVGINASKTLSLKYNASLNCGRVQTPTLEMVFQRENKINHFKAKAYYGYELMLDNVKFTTHHTDFDINKATAFIDSNKNKMIKRVLKTEKIKKSSPKPLFNLTDVQQLASSIFSISPKQTLNILQSLYEKHKVLTYPRTDSRYLTSDMKSTILDRLRAMSKSDYATYVLNLIKTKQINTQRIINNHKVSDHHAIIPTEEKPKFNLMSDLEIKIYHLVCKRFLENLLDDCVFVEVNNSFELSGKTFVNRYEQIKNIGYKIIEHTDEIKHIHIKDNAKIEKLSIIKKETTPPAHFTEGSLIYAMENPFEYVDSQEDKNILKNTNGIGTVATRADILEKLFSNDYLILDNGKIKTTHKAKQLLSLVPEQLKSPALTALWESKLDQISKNKLSKEAFLEEIKQYTYNFVEEIKNSTDKFKHDNISGKKCDKCASYMLEVDKKGTKLLKCSNINCKQIKIISRITNLRCQTCHKKMVLFGNGGNATYRCSCGYSIKQKAVDHNIKQNKKEKASYQDIKKYMQKDKDTHNPLKDILANLKIGD